MVRQIFPTRRYRNVTGVLRNLAVAFEISPVLWVQFYSGTGSDHLKFVQSPHFDLFNSSEKFKEKLNSSSHDDPPFFGGKFGSRVLVALLTAR